MEEPPPPYPGSSLSNSQKEDYQSETSLQNRDLQIYSHPHDLLVSIIDAKDGCQPSTMLRHWDAVHSGSSPKSTTSMALPVKLSLESLKLIRGFQDLGTGTISLFTTDTFSAAGVHQYLTSLLPNNSSEIPQTSSDTKTITHILKHIHNSSSSPSSQNISVQLYTIPVFSETPDRLITGTGTLTWKWAKPESVYDPKSGRWKPDVDQAVEDGEWAAGRGLSLLVGGDSEEIKEELVDLKKIFPSLNHT